MIIKSKKQTSFDFLSHEICKIDLTFEHLAKMSLWIWTRNKGSSSAVFSSNMLLIFKQDVGLETKLRSCVELPKFCHPEVLFSRLWSLNNDLFVFSGTTAAGGFGDVEMELTGTTHFHTKVSSPS